MEIIGVLEINEYARDKRVFRMLGQTARLGRAPHCDVVLADVAVSRDHARIGKNAAGGLVLEDRGSRNGTFLNGERLADGEKRRLGDGDEILVGRSVLRISLEPAKATDPVVEDSSQGSTRDGWGGRRDQERTARLFRADGLVARLIVSASGSAVATFRLERDESLIGRAADADVVIADESVSDYHAEIIYTKDGFHLVDRGSSRPTCVDGVAVRVARLSNHSYLQLGNMKALFVIENSGKRAPVASFAQRDRLVALFPQVRVAIHHAFRLSRLTGTDFAAELLAAGVLDAEQWWRAMREETEPEASARRFGWFSRLLRCASALSGVESARDRKR